MYRQTLLPLLATASILGHCSGRTPDLDRKPISPAQTIVDTSTVYSSQYLLIGGLPKLDLPAEIAITPLDSPKVIITVWDPEEATEDVGSLPFAILEEVVEKWRVPLVGFERRAHDKDGVYQEPESFGKDLSWLVESMEEQGATPIGVEGIWFNVYDLILTRFHNSITEGVGKYNTQSQECREMVPQLVEKTCKDPYFPPERVEWCRRSATILARDFCRERHKVQREHIEGLQWWIEKIMGLFGPYTFPFAEDPETEALTVDNTQYDVLTKKFAYSWGAYETVDNVLESMEQYGASQALLFKSRGALAQLTGYLNERGISHIDLFVRPGDRELYEQEPLSFEDLQQYREQLNDALFQEIKDIANELAERERSKGVKL